MITPAGKECQYFYGDYYRGRHHEECRLIQATDPEHEWKPHMCAKCPVPEILQANACEHMDLKAVVYRTLWIFKPQVRIEAYCTKSEEEVSEPHVGCGQCHRLPPVFLEEEGN